MRPEEFISGVSDTAGNNNRRLFYKNSSRSAAGDNLMLTGDEESGGADGVEYLINDGWKTNLLVNFDGGYGEQISHLYQSYYSGVFVKLYP